MSSVKYIKATSLISIQSIAFTSCTEAAAICIKTGIDVQTSYWVCYFMAHVALRNVAQQKTFKHRPIVE
jgi:hypothetical protein